MKAAVITISDRASQGVYADTSGQALVRLLEAEACEVQYSLIPDDKEKLNQALGQALGCTWIFTTGGTGIGPKDFTPECTEAFCDRAVPGIAEYLRAESLNETPFAVFSRAYAGIKNQSLVVNFPGSERGAVFCLKLLLPLLKHGASMVQGGGHN